MRVDLMQQIEQEPSHKGKAALLRQACADALTLSMLQWALNPYITFGIRVNKERVMAGLVHDSDEEQALFGGQFARDPEQEAYTPTAWWPAFMETVLQPLSKREITGGEAARVMYGLLQGAPSALDADWACRILNKDLACGVAATTLNKVVPGAVPVFEVALAAPMFNKAGVLVLDPAVYARGWGFVEPKIDGERVIVHQGVPLSRYGREIEGEGKWAVLKELQTICSKLTPPFNNIRRWVFDGELIGEGTFEQTIGQIRTKGDLTYHVFDVMKVDEWNTKHTRPFHRRRKELESILSLADPLGCVRLVHSYTVLNPTLEDLFRWRDEFIKKGYEGAMWKRADARYAFRRTADIIKIKPWETFDFRVLDWYLGEDKYDGMLGGIILQVDDEGVESRCGSGFSDEQRAKWADGPDFKWAEVKFQNKTAKGSLRHPIFIRPRYDKEE